MGRILGARVAGGAAGRVDPFHLQLEQDRLTLDAGDADIHVPGKAPPPVAVQERAGNTGLDALEEAIPQPPQSVTGGLEVLIDQLQSSPEGSDAGHVLGAGTAMLLHVTTSM